MIFWIIIPLTAAELQTVDRRFGAPQKCQPIQDNARVRSKRYDRDCMQQIKCERHFVTVDNAGRLLAIRNKLLFTIGRHLMTLAERMSTSSFLHRTRRHTGPATTGGSSSSSRPLVQVHGNRTLGRTEEWMDSDRQTVAER